MRLLGRPRGAGWILLGLVATGLASRPAAAAPAPSTTRASAGFSYEAYGRLLARHVDPAGHVDYAGLQADRRSLDAVLRRFAASSPENKPQLFRARADRLAYWINAYNVFVLSGAVRRWPARTVRSGTDDTFFRTDTFTAGGRRYTLDEIEGRIIRGQFREPRIHFTVNCGAASCPVLRPEPFTGADLDERLDRAARLFVNDSTSGVRFDVAAGTIALSEIFRWYADDFLAALRARGATDPTVLDYVALYLDAPARARLESRRWTVQYLPYDWSLNALTLPVR